MEWLIVMGIFVLTIIINFFGDWLGHRFILQSKFNVFFRDLEKDENVCIACGSSNLEWLGEEYYYCRDCDFEGGEGLRRKQEEERRKAIVRLSKEERLRSAADDLRLAEAYLDSAIHRGKSLRRMITADIIGIGSNSRNSYGSEYEEVQNSFFSDLVQLEQALRNANDKLFDWTNEKIPIVPEINLREWQFDVWVDNFFSDLQRRKDVNNILDYLEKLRETISKLRAHLPAPDG